MGENYIVINGKKAELTQKQLEKLGIKEDKNRRWRAENGERYWFAKLSMNKCGYDAVSDTEMYSLVDDGYYYTHNYFQTKEDADKYASVLNTEMELMKYADENNEEFGKHVYLLKYCDNKIFHHKVNKVEVPPRNIKFSNDIIAHRAIISVGTNRVIEYLTYEW